MKNFKPSRDYNFRSKYIDNRMAELFKVKLLEVQPDIVYINHLSHLSTQILSIVKESKIPIFLLFMIIG